MDFQQFDSRTAAETAQDLHLKHPATGQPLYADGKACIVKVLGMESRTVQKALRAVDRRKMGVKDGDTRTLEELQEALIEGARPLIAGFENVMRGDKPATVADADWFLRLQLLNGQEGEQSFLEQVTGFAAKRANFLGNALSD